MSSFSPRRQTRSVTTCMGSWACTTKTAQSAALWATKASAIKPPSPGVSRMLIWRPFHSRWATFIPSVISRSASSSVWSSTLPAAPFLPDASPSIASARAVFPLPRCPIKQTFRISSGSTAIGFSFPRYALSHSLATSRAHSLTQREPSRSLFGYEEASKCAGRRKTPRLVRGVRLVALNQEHHRALEQALDLGHVVGPLGAVGGAVVGREGELHEAGRDELVVLVVGRALDDAADGDYRGLRGVDDGREALYAEHAHVGDGDGAALVLVGRKVHLTSASRQVLRLLRDGGETLLGNILDNRGY